MPRVSARPPDVDARRRQRRRVIRRRRIVVGAAAVLILAGLGTAGVVIFGSSPAAHPAAAPPAAAAPTTAAPTTTTVPEPAATSTPDAPGIAIAAPGVPLPNYDLPGPSMLHVGHTDYLYLSTALGVLTRNVTVVTGSPGHWDWANARDAMPTSPAWATPNNGTFAGGQVWEPQVFRLGSSYVMYSSPTIDGSNPVQHCIGIARSASPLGPFIPSPNPIVCQRDQGGDIDAQLFVDPGGPNGPAHPNYLVWKSDNNSAPGLGNPYMWVAGLSADGTALTTAAKPIFTADQTWQRGLVEAPQLLTGPDGAIYLFYSGGQGYYTTNYAMGVARCATVFGPCTDLSATPLVQSNSQGAGPGEETVFVGPDKSVWLLYNPWGTGTTLDFFRPVEAVRIGFNASGPYVADAGTFPAP